MAVGAAAAHAAYATLPTRFHDEPLTSALYAPASLALLPDGRVLVAEQRTARVVLVLPGTPPLTATGLLVVDSVRSTFVEQGLLGIAVDPGWPARPYLYVVYDFAGAPTIRLSRYRVGGDLAFSGDGHLSVDPASRYDVLADIPDVNLPHNAGAVRFAPDGKLMMSTGDDFVDCDAQDLTRLSGKLLRLDVSLLPDGPGGPPAKSLITPTGNPFPTHTSANARLVWAYGLRNPFRLHIDSATGAVFVSDVGSATFEEIDRLTVGGANLGWPWLEGPMSYESCTAAASGFAAPIHAYDRSAVASSAVIGFGIYRARAGAARGFPPDYDGDYFFADYSQGFLRRIKQSGATWALAPASGQPNAQDWGTGYAAVTDALEGANGELYYLRQSPLGELRRIYYDYGALDAEPAALRGVRFVAGTPSPAHGAARFELSLDVDRDVELTVLDADGRRAATVLPAMRMNAGRHELRWDGRIAGRIAPSGVYFARLRVGSQALTRRFVWLR